MLSAFQDAFVALASRAQLRREFQQDRAVALSAWDLDADERAALMAIPLDALERYAVSLIAKRWGDVSRVVPLTRKVSPRLAARYESWLADAPARAVDTVLPPGAAEALRMLPAMSAAILADGAEASYAADLLAYEVLSACSRIDGGPRLMRSRHRIDTIARDLERGLVPIDPDDEPTEFRFTGPRIEHRRIG